MHSKLLHSLLSVVFPTFCPVCNQRLTDRQDEICQGCLDRLPRTGEIAIEGNITEDKFHDYPNVVRCAAWLQYSPKNITGQLIHKLKYQSHPWIGYYLGRAVAEEYIPFDFFNTIDIIIPVPLHPKRLRERGYNQAEWIARGIREEIGVPIDTAHVKRIVDNTKQAHLIGPERKKNVSNIFRVDHPEELYHKHILLVDDVITTGATLRSCIQATKSIRGCRISVLALAKP